MASCGHRLLTSKRPCSAQIGPAIYHTPGSSARIQYIDLSRRSTELGMVRTVTRVFQDSGKNFAQPESGRSLLSPDATRFMVTYSCCLAVYYKGVLRAHITLSALYTIQQLVLQL